MTENINQARQVLTASYDFDDNPVDITERDGLAEAIREVAETKEDVWVSQPDSVVDYKVYWNSQTDTVRFAAMVAGASYEVSPEFLETDTKQ